MLIGILKVVSIYLLLSFYSFAQNIFWERVNAPNHTIAGMIFLENGNILAATYTGGVFITSNRGDSWFSSNQGLNNYNLYAVEKTSSGLVFIGTGGNGIYRSDDDGHSWTYFGLNNIYINTISVLNDNEIFTGTFGNGVFYSSDKGNTWVDRSNGIVFPVIMTMTINDSGFVFLCTDTGRMYRTVNKGLDWIEINNGLPYTTANAILVDNIRILYAGNDLGLYLSGNNGNLWLKRTNGLTGSNVLAIANNSSNHLFIAVYSDGVYRSVNQGHNWIKENYGIGNYDIYKFLVSDDDYIFASGWANDFFRTKHSTVVSIEDENITFTKNFKLEQNYPNPFNPNTNIQYAIGSRLTVSLKVYDILGNEIATLVNEEKPTGEYEVEFNATGLPSGIYFYKLTAGEYNQTQKMIYLK
jgi:photosystem II stability/assembly factor-like uncharacterized protein